MVTPKGVHLMADELPEGDPRVYWIINLILSFFFAWMILWGIEFLTEFEWDWITLILTTIIIAIVSHLLVGRS